MERRLHIRSSSNSTKQANRTKQAQRCSFITLLLFSFISHFCFVSVSRLFSGSLLFRSFLSAQTFLGFAFCTTLCWYVYNTLLHPCIPILRWGGLQLYDRLMVSKVRSLISFLPWSSWAVHRHLSLPARDIGYGCRESPRFNRRIRGVPRERKKFKYFLYTLNTFRHRRHATRLAGRFPRSR